MIIFEHLQIFRALLRFTIWCWRSSPLPQKEGDRGLVDLHSPKEPSLLMISWVDYALQWVEDQTIPVGGNFSIWPSFRIPLPKKIMGAKMADAWYEPWHNHLRIFHDLKVIGNAHELGFFKPSAWEVDSTCHGRTRGLWSEKSWATKCWQCEVWTTLRPWEVKSIMKWAWPPSTIRKCFRSLLFRTSVIPQTKHSEAWRRTAMNWEWLLSRSYVKSCEVMEISEFDQHFNSGPWNISTPLSCQHPRKPGSRKAIREVSIVLTSGANMPRVVGRRNDSSTKSQSPEFGSNSW